MREVRILGSMRWNDALTNMLRYACLVLWLKYREDDALILSFSIYTSVASSLALLCVRVCGSELDSVGAFGSAGWDGWGRAVELWYGGSWTRRVQDLWSSAVAQEYVLIMVIIISLGELQVELRYSSWWPACGNCRWSVGTHHDDLLR